MTDKTTRIWVDLTDEQMDKHGDTTYIHGNADHALYLAIKAQRPRPIAVGDIVTWGTRAFGCEVAAIKGGKAWLWFEGNHYDTLPLACLTRVDDEAAT